MVKKLNNNGSGELIESREVCPYLSHVNTHTLINQHKQICTQISHLKKTQRFLHATHKQYMAHAYLGLLDTGHVLFGQARAMQGLLWVFSVALEHLGLQLSAQRRSLPRSTQEQRAERRVSVIITQDWECLHYCTSLGYSYHIVQTVYFNGASPV